MKDRILLLLIVVSLVGAAGVVGGASAYETTNVPEVVQENSTTTHDGVELRATFYEGMDVELEISNTANETRSITHTAMIEDEIIATEELTLQPGESIEREHSFYEYRHPTERKQVVRVQIDYHGLNHGYDEPVVSGNATNLLLPEIDEIEIDRSQNETVMSITIAQHSPHSLFQHLTVHTERGEYGAIPSNPTNDSTTDHTPTETITVELEEGPNEPVNGTIWFWMKNPSEMSEGLDTVHFNETSPGEVEMRSVEYEPTYLNSPNEHYQPTGVGAVREDAQATADRWLIDPPLPVQLLPVAGALLFAAALLRRHDYL